MSDILAPDSYVAEVWIDPVWYQELGSDEPLPLLNRPRIVKLTDGVNRIGRVIDSPEIDCGSDVGVSRLHAKLEWQEDGWVITDVGSRNGTFVGMATGPLPKHEIKQPTKITDGHRIYVGSWTRIVVRPALIEELKEK